MSASEMSVETLKKSLAANGLAQYGTKEQRLHRLETVLGGKAHVRSETGFKNPPE